MKRTITRSNGTTTCCNVDFFRDPHSGTRGGTDDEYCMSCGGNVQIRIVKVERNELLMMAGVTPCGDSMPVPRKRKRKKPRTTARHGRGKTRKR